MDKINQLNILRESNATLRSDAEANRKRAERFQSQLLRLKTEHEPIKLELVTAKAELEERQRQNEQFQSDIEQLKERFASVSLHDLKHLTSLPNNLLGSTIVSIQTNSRKRSLRRKPPRPRLKKTISRFVICYTPESGLTAAIDRTASYFGKDVEGEI